MWAARAWQAVRNFWRSVFGEVSWSRPAWLAALAAWFLRTPMGFFGARAVAWLRANPRRGAAVVVGSVCTLVAIGYGGYRYKLYLDSQPEPNWVEVKISEPHPTDPKTKLPEHLFVKFSASVAKLDDLNRDVTASIHLNPAIAGNWRWTSDRSLEFTPKDVGATKTDWAIGQSYRLEFDRKFFPRHLLFKTRTYEFRTEPLTLSFDHAEFYVDPTNPKTKKVVATVSSNYPVNTDELRKRVSFALSTADASILGKAGGQTAFSVTYNAFFTEAHLESEALAVPKEDQVMKITIDKGVRAQREGPATGDAVETKVDVPGLFTAFKITAANVIFARNERYEPEQVFVLETALAARSEDLEKNLEVFLLPADHRPPGEKKVVKNYEWQSASEITPDVRSKLEPVALKLVPAETTWSKTHAFKIDVPVERSLYVRLKKGARALGEYELGQDYLTVARTPDFTRELMFMSKGSILSFSGDKKLPLLARNVDKVTFEIGRIIPGQVNHLVWRILQNGDFSKPYDIDEIQNSIAERFTVEQKLPYRSRAETIYFSLDLEPYLKDDRGFFYVRVNSKNGPSDARLILVSDLGLIAKQATAGSTDLFVQDFRSGTPVADAQVQVVGQNGIAVLTVPSDAQGRAQLPALKDYKNEKRPLAFVVRKGGDVSYLPYELSERQLSYSRFDVGGVYESSESDQLSAMLFSDRGIYRPGEKVDLGLIVRSKKWSQALPRVPLVWSVTDPRGNLIKEETFQGTPFSLAELGFGTTETSPTGNYEIRVQIVKKQNGNETRQLLGSLMVKVEEFVPDTLRVAATLEPSRSKGWVTAPKLAALVSLKNLYGTPAENRKVKSQMVLSPIAPTVPAFKDYMFANLNKKDAQTVTETLDERKTSAQGEVSYELDLSKYEGFFRLRFETEGFDAGSGRGVSAIAVLNVSRFPFLVGFKADGDLHYINRGADRNVQLIAVDPAFAATQSPELKLVLVERKFVSALMKQDDGTYKYQSVRRDKELKTEDLSVPKQGLSLKLPTATAGDYTWFVRDDAGHELNHVDFSVVAEENLSRAVDRSAELQLSLNHPDYRPGDEIEMQIKAPYKGAGLITIERDNVYAFKWFKTAKTSTVERIRIPEGLEGNAYVSVTFLRAIDSKEIFMSPLSYGVQPFFISLDQQRTRISLNVPERVKPGETLKVRYSADRPTSLILYGVNEGILQVARYTLPDPLGYFFRKRALQVRTFQLLDLLLPEYALLKEMSTPSSDAGFDSLGKNLNPFRRKDQPPVVFWSGVVQADSKTRTYEYQVPDYFNGNLRIMAVASSARGLGSIAASTVSRGDFVITPSTPAFVAPGDQLTVAVNLSNQLEGKKAETAARPTLTLEPSRQFEVVGPRTQTIDVAPGHEKSVDFVLKARPELGSAELKFTAESGGARARITSSVSVRPPVPYVTTLKAGTVRDLPLELPLDRKLYSEYRKVELGLSPVPMSLGFALASYLEDYPYLCTEQLVSRAVPNLVFRGRPEFALDLKKANEYHEGIISVLRVRQVPSGGFSLYGRESVANAPATLHAIEYLIASREKGYRVPEELVERAQGFLRSSELRHVENLSAARLFAQALYLQTRLGWVPTNDLAFLSEALDKSFKGKWEQDAIAIYLAGAYQLLKEEDRGRALVKGLKLGEYDPHDYGFYQDGFTRDAQLIQVVARHYPALLPRLAEFDSLVKFVGQVQQYGFNSYSSAEGLLAIAALTDVAANSGGAANLAIRAAFDKEERPLAVPKGTSPRVGVPLGATKLVVDGQTPTPYFYALAQKGFDTEWPATEQKNKLEVGREYLTAAGQPVAKVKLGDEVDVSLRVRTLDGKFARNLVLVDLYPAGFELVLNKKAEAEPAGEPATEPAGESGDEGARVEKPRSSLWSFQSLIADAYAAAQDVTLKTMHPEFADFRDDRVVVYGSAGTSVTEFHYRLKAVARGKFSVPPPFGESLYDRSISYRGVMKSIEIE